MANTNSSLATPMLLTKNFTFKKSKKVLKITIHHAAGVNATLAGMKKTFMGSRSASANYGIDSKGAIALYVEEKNRAWTSSSSSNDNKAVTIEVANCGGAPNWEVSDEAVKSLINLCVDICKRNNLEKLEWTGNSKGSLTVHRMFKATTCPGPYLYGLMPWIAGEVSARLKGKSGEIIIPKVDEKTKEISSNSINNVGVKYYYNGVDLSPVFNPYYYYSKYPDLQKTIGMNEDNLFNHFINFGMNEGRIATESFNPKIYKQRYSDLASVYGEDWKFYYIHYCSFGIKENRKGC